ncbi:hypothetical protein [Teichococcus vastitatis]|uniref:Bacteriophage-related protein n=1 Tax=Teichococcus vastitatis TaxID=2307076 RepID=A0ABS9W2N5_9PROT|nr:hypothetical protein [Pseudoroseomonas vastitatis]MCI0753560.1 hypothetical protein [Pseudoroseomonas vastitatis]
MSTSITVSVPLSIRHRPGRKTIVRPVGAAEETALTTRGDPALVKALARAFRWKKLLDEGRHASISELASAERIERGYLGQILRLTLLAPELVEAILDGRQPEGMTLPRLLDPFPAGWAEQRASPVTVRHAIQSADAAAHP